MKNITRIQLVCVMQVSSLWAADLTNAAENVQCWHPHDVSFTTKATVANPFMVSFSATVNGPDGKSFTLPGFYDGDDTWKIKVAPNAEGKWSFVTKSDVEMRNNVIRDNRARSALVKSENTTGLKLK